MKDKDYEQIFFLHPGFGVAVLVFKRFKLEVSEKLPEGNLRFISPRFTSVEVWTHPLPTLIVLLGHGGLLYAIC